MKKVFGIRIVSGDTFFNFKSLHCSSNSCTGNNPWWRYGCITDICWSGFKSNLVRNRKYKLTRICYWCPSGKILLQMASFILQYTVQKFINAGADAIISNTFFVNHTNLETELNMTEEQASETILGLSFLNKQGVYHTLNLTKPVRYAEYRKRSCWWSWHYSHRRHWSSCRWSRHMLLSIIFS